MPSRRPSPASGGGGSLAREVPVSPVSDPDPNSVPAVWPSPPPSPAGGRRGSPPVPAPTRITVSATDLGTGRVTHTFDVTEQCPLARVELDLEVESMPDGVVTLRSPSGREARLALHVLTTTHFVRTWDWARLDALHALRGEPAGGSWTLEVRATGAYYAGGTQPGAPMPAPSFPRAELRLFCEPAHRDVAPGTELEARVEVPASRAPSGGHVRALVPIVEDCQIASLTVALVEDARFEIGHHLRLVAPDGSTFALEATRPRPLGRAEVFTREVVGVTGQRSAGLWEVLRARAAGSVEIREATLQIRCAD